MNYLFIGFLLSIGWELGEFLMDMFILNRAAKKLHETEWYKKYMGENKRKKPAVKSQMKIGF